MMIYRDEYYNPETTRTREADIIVAKNRHGSVGTVNLYFDANLVKFAGLEKP
jgi:replicative DNA helicase